MILSEVRQRVEWYRCVPNGARYSWPMTRRVGLGLMAWVLLARLACGQVAPAATMIRDVAPGSGVLVVRSDGSVVTWAKSPQGTIQAPTALSLPGPARRVAVGGSNLGRFTGYAVFEDGTVVAWGANDEGQLGNGAPGADVTPGIYPKPSIAPVRVTGLKDAIDVAAGDRHAVALRGDGSVWAWGTRDDGALGGGEVVPKGSVRVLSAMAPVRVPLEGVTQIAVAARHTLALTREGRVYGWGSNRMGELGNGTRDTGWTPSLVPSLERIVAIAAGNGGNGHGVSGALRDDGTVWMWGTNDSAMIGNSQSAAERDDGTLLHAVPEQVRGITTARGLSIGGGHVAVLLADGTLRMWGHNGYGGIGNGTSGAYVPRPVKVTGLTDVVAVHLGMMRSYAVRADGSLWVWGFKQLERGVLGRHLNVPTRLDLP